MGVFSLTGWARLIRAEFLVLRVTQDNTMSSLASYKGLSPAMAERSSSFYSQSKYNILCSYYPTIALLQPWFGLLPVRSPLLRESFNYFLLLEVLRCFSSLRLPY